MNRADVDKIYNGIKGEGLNDTGNFSANNRQAPVAPINFDEPIDYNLAQPTIGDLRNIVNTMSDDRDFEYEDRGTPNRPYVDGLPRTAPHPFYGDHDETEDNYNEEIGEYLYNNPWEKSVYNYFGDEGLAGWLVNQTGLSSPKQQDAFAEALNILEAKNTYDRDRQEYADFLTDLVKQNRDKGYYAGQRLVDSRPRSRQRNITGSAK